MSGINTLIDTLMHSVLGKRVDIPLQKELNAPVRPISPSDAPLAVRSDSRLEPGQVAARQPLGQSPSRQTPLPLPSDGGPQPSIQASLSPAARQCRKTVAGPVVPGHHSRRSAPHGLGRFQRGGVRVWIRRRACETGWRQPGETWRPTWTRSNRWPRYYQRQYHRQTYRQR